MPGHLPTTHTGRPLNGLVEPGVHRSARRFRAAGARHRLGGCIGSWALAILARAGVPAVAFDLDASRRRPGLLSAEEDLDRVVWEQGDIADPDTVDRVVSSHGVGAIIHLAGLQVPFCAADPVGGARVNVIGTATVFEAARRHGLRRVAYASTSATTAPSPWKMARPRRSARSGSYSRTAGSRPISDSGRRTDFPPMRSDSSVPQLRLMRPHGIRVRRRRGHLANTLRESRRRTGAVLDHEARHSKLFEASAWPKRVDSLVTRELGGQNSFWCEDRSVLSSAGGWGGTWATIEEQGTNLPTAGPSP